MALPPDSNETFLREVDENLRRDQIRDLGKKYGGWILGAALLFLAAVGGWLYWKQNQVTQAQEDSEALSAIFDDIAANRIDTAPQRLQTLGQDASPGVAAVADFSRAALALQKNDRRTATGIFRDIQARDDLPQPFRDLAQVRLTALEFDSLKPEEVVARLAPLAKPGNPWFGSAGEMTAMAYLKQNKRAEAGRLFGAIAADQQVPPSIRARAVQIAGTLGVDASASMPTAAQ